MIRLVAAETDSNFQISSDVSLQLVIYLRISRYNLDYGSISKFSIVGIAS